jgi:hypothetical protein
MQKGVIRIRNLEGRTLSTISLQVARRKGFIDVSRLSAGSYHLLIETPKLTIHEKFIKL